MRGVLAASLATAFLIGACGGDSDQEVERSLPPREGTPPTQATPFDGLSTPERGQLSGRIYYIAYNEPECSLHVYDPATGGDEPLGVVTKNCAYLRGFTVSPDGTRIAWRGEQDEIVLLELATRTARVLHAPRKLGEQYLHGATPGPLFSPDSRSLGWCAGEGERAEFVVADVLTGQPVSRGSPGCRAAFTSAGLAELRQGRVFLAGRPLELAPPPGTLQVETKVPYQLVASADGSHIALVSHGVPAGQSKVTGVIDVYEPSGAPVARFVQEGDLGIDGMTLRFAIERLSPVARSATVWWGCIMQLAPLAAGERFALLFGEYVALGQLAYSPDGRYAVMAREDHAPIPSGGGEVDLSERNADAVVLDGETFEPRFSLPIHARNLSWVA